MEVKPITFDARRLVQLGGPDCCRDVFDRADNPILMIERRFGLGGEWVGSWYFKVMGLYPADRIGNNIAQV